MVQIIQSGPSEATLRQQALNQALQGAIQGFGAYQAQEDRKAQTLRQQALADKQAQAAKESQDLQLALGLLKEGYAPNADAKSILLGTAKPEVISPAMEAQPAQYAAKELAGPVRPGEQLGSTQEMVKPAQPARPEVLGPKPELTYTAKKQAEMAEKAAKTAQQEEDAKQSRLLRDYQITELARKETTRPLEMLKQQKEFEKLGLQTEKERLELGMKKAESGPEVIPGFIKTTTAKTSEKDKEELKKTSGFYRDVESLGNKLIDNINKFGITTGYGATEGSRLTAQNITALQLKLKDMAGLGALTGPDMDLLNKSIGSIQGNLAVGLVSPEQAIRQVKAVVEQSKESLKGNARARGFEIVDQGIEAKVKRLQDLRQRNQGGA